MDFIRSEHLVIGLNPEGSRKIALGEAVTHGVDCEEASRAIFREGGKEYYAALRGNHPDETLITAAAAGKAKPLYPNTLVEYDTLENA